MRTASSAWHSMLRLAARLLAAGTPIPTLVRGNLNSVVKVDPNSIAVRSHHGRRSHRLIERLRAERAWRILLRRGRLELRHIDPLLRGRKSATFALLAAALPHDLRVDRSTSRVALVLR